VLKKQPQPCLKEKEIKTKVIKLMETANSRRLNQKSDKGKGMAIFLP